MALMISPNAFVTASFLDESRNFFWKPAFTNCRRVIRLNSKKSKTKVMFCLNLNTTKEVSLQTSGDGGFEFKPSFDQYLQVMESVKTARKKKKFERFKIEDGDGGGGGNGGDSVASEVKDVKSKTGVPKDETLRRRYEMVSDKRNERGESGIQKITKDVKWIKSGESEDESFRRRYVKKEMVRIERGSKVDELDLVVEDRRFQRIAKDVRWTKCGESSVTMSDDESFRRRNPKQEMVRYQRFSETSKGVERGSKGDGLDLLAEERRIERLASERHDLRSKLSITRKIGAKKEEDDDDSLFDMGNPAFRFSDESSDIVDKPATSRVEMEDRIDKLAKVLNGADINMPEWLFSKAIRSAKIRYTDYTIMRLIHFLGKLGNWRRVLQVIEWLQRQDCFKSNKLRIIYTTALNVLGKSRRPVEALNVFHAMLLQISSYPDMVAYRSIAVTLGQAGHIKELFHVIDTMRSPPKKKFKPTTVAKWDPRLEPDFVVCNAVLNACVQRKQWEGAFWVLQQLKQRGQKPSLVTCGLVMEVMLACEKYNLVHEFFWKMQKSSIPNTLAYRVLVNTLWKEGKTDETIQTVEEDMESRGIVL